MSLKQVKVEVLDIVKYIIAFYKNPFQNVKRVPSWSWLSLVLLIFTFASLTGLLRGVISGSLAQSIIGFIFLPISSYAIILTLSCILYVLVVLFQNRNLNFKRLTTLIFVASIPTITIYTLSIFHPFFVPLGFTFTFLLIGFGLYNRFQLNKNFILVSASVIYFIIFLIWIFGYLNLQSSQKTQNFIDTELHKSAVEQ